MSKLFNLLAQYIPETKINIFGGDGLLLSTLPYYSLAAITVLGYSIVWSHPWLLVALLYAVLPFLDEIFIRDYVNPTEQQRKLLQKRDFQFKVCLYVTLFVDWVIFFKIMQQISLFQINLQNLFNLVGVVFIYTNLSATQFALAHQIYHKGSFFNKCLGTFHMSKNLYTQFAYEHLYGHHRKVATPEDPASAPIYISSYRFFVRSFIGSIKSVYKMQVEQNKKIYQNYAVLSTIWSIAFTSLMFWIFGIQAGCFFLLQAFVSIFLSETINYIQHYGLSRNRLENGQYEKVSIKHSWNAPHRFTNYLLFKLQRHSDHHQNSMKPYQTLLSLNQSPQLPHGYSLMVSMALFPPIWFKVMNPLALEYKRVKNGSVRTEVTELALYQSKIFAIQIALASVGVCLLEFIF